MSKIMDLKNKRAQLWEASKKYLEDHRGEDGLVPAEDTANYEKMLDNVKALGDEISRLENQKEIEDMLSAPTSMPVKTAPSEKKPKNVKPTATDEYSKAFWDMITNRGDQLVVRNDLSVGVDENGGYTVPDEFSSQLLQKLEENNIFRSLATVIRTNSGTHKIPIALDTMEASWIDEGEEIPETDTKFGQTTLSAYKLGTTIKSSNELLHDSAFDLASYIATRFGVAMGTAEEKAFLSGTGEKQPTGILNDTNGAETGVTTSSATVSFDDIFDLYYSLRAPYRRNAAFLCNEALMLTLMKLKDNNGNYIWKPSLDIAKPDTILGRPVYTSVYMPEVASGNKAVLFGDYKYYYVADRQARTFKRLNELYARTDQVGFITTQRVDGKLILPEAVKALVIGGSSAAKASTTTKTS